MRNKLLWLIGILMTAGGLVAASVSTSEYRHIYQQYGRSDGVFQRLDSQGFDYFVNGYRLQSVGGHAVYEDFSEYGDGDQACIQTDYTACSGTTGEFNYFTLGSGNTMIVEIEGGDSTSPDMDAGSLDIAGDQANDEGVELAWGFRGASGKPFIIGESPAFYTCGTFTIADASGTDDFAIGFRTLEDFQDGINSYDSYTAIGIVGSANPNNIKIQTEDDGGGETDTDTTNNWSDAEEHTLCVYVSAAGVTTYTLDSLPPATTAAYTWDDATAVIPFIKLLQHSDLTGEVDLTEWEVGYATAPF